MKLLRFICVLVCFITVFASCSSDIDLYADYKDVPIIYGMLNARADTNYIKITRAFCGTNDNPIDANEVALISDSSNYPDKLYVRIIELKNTYGMQYQPTGRAFLLDTITIHNKEEGVFYSPDQVVYYTTESFNTNSESARYRYRLVVVKPDGDTVTALTNMVGDEDFSIVTRSLSFQSTPSEAFGNIYFRADGIAPLYEVGIQFNYLEQMAGHGIREKHVKRSFGTRPITEFNKIEGSENSYYLEYSVNWLFNALANAIGSDTIIDPEHPNVARYIDDFVITISAAGEDLYYYYLSNQAQEGNAAGFVSVYSNIEGGYGVFSSRSTIRKVVGLSKNTLDELYSKASWGFQEQ